MGATTRRDILIQHVESAHTAAVVLEHQIPTKLNDQTDKEKIAPQDESGNGQIKSVAGQCLEERMGNMATNEEQTKSKSFDNEVMSVERVDVKTPAKAET